jgi:hypothetical protein
MKNIYFGQCHCGQAKLTIKLPKPLLEYQSRACDCDFCTSRNISYLSDPDSQIEIISDTPLLRSQQGSNQATFLSCNQCHTVLAVALIEEDISLGAINVSVIQTPEPLQSLVMVSPQRLNAAERKQRWKTLWGQLKLPRAVHSG